MQTFKDCLIYYNNLDTGPFVTTLSSFVSIYTQQKIDSFKDYVTLPGVARILLYAFTESNFPLSINKMLIYITLIGKIL